MDFNRDFRPHSWRVVAQLQWEPRDLWIGLFWRLSDGVLHVYICVVPLVPLHVTIGRT